MSNRRAIVLLSALTIGFYWKLTLSRQFTFLDSPDLAYMTLPWYQFQASALHRGVIPLWDPYQWCGQTVVGQMQPGLAFPLNWPLFAAPLRDGRLNLDLFHWHYVFLHWLAALFMYAYCRQLGRGQFASILAACAFSFGGFVGGTTWPQVMNGALWMPLIFLFYHRAGNAQTTISSAANAAGCGGAIGLALMAGHHQAPMLEILALTGVFVFHFLTRQDRWRRLALFGLTAVFGALVGALLLIPAWEYGSRVYRWVNLDSPVRLQDVLPYITQRDLALRPLDLLGLSTPIDGGTTHPLVGLAPAALALLGVAACWRLRAVRLHASLAVAALAYGLGLYSVFQGVLYAAVPFLNKSRSPSYAELILQFGLLVVAAHGADVLFSPGVWQKRLVRALVAVVALFVAAQSLVLVGEYLAPHRANTLIVGSAVALLLVAAQAGGRQHLRAAQLGVLAALLLELGASSAPVLLPRTNPENPTTLDRLARHRSIIEFLRSQPGPFRVHIDDQQMPHNAGDWDGIETSGGYLATVSSDLFDLISLNWNSSALLVNQVYEVRGEKSRPEQVEVFAEPGGLKVFRNPDAHPRVWMVRGVRQVANRAEAEALMNSADFNPRREAFMFAGRPKPPVWPPCEGEATVEWITRDIDRITARARTHCEGMVVFADPLFPGWSARVDGAPAQLYAAYGALRGVIVPAGDHRIEFAYRPWSVYVGAALTGIGVLGWLLLALAARARESRTPAATRP